MVCSGSYCTTWTDSDGKEVGKGWSTVAKGTAQARDLTAHHACLCAVWVKYIGLVSLVSTVAKGTAQLISS